MGRKWLIGVFICVLPCVAAWAQAPAAAPKPTLMGAWFALPEVDRINWPYAFIRLPQTDELEKGYRDDVLVQIKNLHWRLQDKGYPELAATVQAWKKRLAETHFYREPGDWSPAWLISHPHQRPPYDRVESIGYCHMPGTVEVWDKHGVHDMKWRAGLRLSDVLSDDPNLVGGRDDLVAIVWPQGHIDHYGVAAWNEADTELMPGTVIVGAIDLSGEVFPWLRDTIAKLMAHTPIGTQCRAYPLQAPGQDHD